jgi:hypothetical protein
MTIDDEYNSYDANELFDNQDNSMEGVKVENLENSSENSSDDNDSSESENLPGDDDSFDDNSVDILQEELYSDDELLSNFDDNLAEGKNMIYNI